MGFERFGIVGFVAETKAADFINHLEAGKVMVTKCKGCGRIFSPPKMDCTRCKSSDVEWLEVRGKGRLLSYATVYFAPTGFEEDLPYTLALAQFPGGINIFGRLSKGVELGEIEIGMELKLTSVTLPGDRICYEFAEA